ncbi:hypothetical protein H8E88_10245 [candidate division KSB1 bacterium]|nr:hypothetical protein [candidate division KSB1 bacterium]
MPAIEIIKGQREKPLVMMTRPDGNPADVPARLVETYLERGFIKGYKESPEVTKRRAANKIDLVAENAELKKQLAKMQKK